MPYEFDLKEFTTEKIEGKDMIKNPNPKNSIYSPHKLITPPYIDAKHTYLKCNACGKKFSLNYSDKTFEEAKQVALKKKWEHAEKEHHHQSETLYLGEEEVDGSPLGGSENLIETERKIHEEAMKTMDKWYRGIISQLQEENKAKEEELKVLRNKERELLEIKVKQLSSRIEKLEIQQAQIEIPPK